MFERPPCERRQNQQPASLQSCGLLLPQEGLRRLTDDLGLGRLGVHLVLRLQRLERLPQLRAAQDQLELLSAY